MARGRVHNKSTLPGVPRLGIRESDPYWQPQAGWRVFCRHPIRANLNFTGTEEARQRWSERSGFSSAAAVATIRSVLTIEARNDARVTAKSNHCCDEAPFGLSSKRSCVAIRREVFIAA